jgi:hypothetical protein
MSALPPIATEMTSRRTRREAPARSGSGCLGATLSVLWCIEPRDDSAGFSTFPHRLYESFTKAACVASPQRSSKLHWKMPKKLASADHQILLWSISWAAGFLLLPVGKRIGHEQRRSLGACGLTLGAKWRAVCGSFRASRLRLYSGSRAAYPAWRCRSLSTHQWSTRPRSPARARQNLTRTNIGF